MKFFIVDGESTIRNRGEFAVGDMAANPFHPDNTLVLFGERRGGVNKQLHVTRSTRDYKYPEFFDIAANEPVLLVGHNIPFDLKYIAKHWPALWRECQHNIYIWDTQQVAYLLSGQTHMYPSLDELCQELGFELKDEKIKQYWEDGVDTSLIPMDELAPYLDHDLEATEAVFRSQYERVSNNTKLFNLVKVKLDDILATNEMEYNGMEFDLVTAHKLATFNDAVIAAHTADIMVKTHGLFAKGFEFNPMSNDHISLWFFGGKYKVKETVPALAPDGSIQYYKTGTRAGQMKMKQADIEYAVPSRHSVPVGLTPNAKGLYAVDKDVLKKLADATEDDAPLTVLALRELSKENETYYRGYSKLVFSDNKIHGSIGHVGTRTGRNNHNKPNLGNVTREE